jgi:glutamate N-acetyltransferase/amino-acid N-acetyltransferase
MTCSFLENGHAATPSGWRASAAACGIKYTGRDDLALLVSETPCTTAALFTTNRVQSAHIHYDREVLARHAEAIRAVLITSGSANACTGEAGIEAARIACHAAEECLALPRSSTLIMSTGVIGIPLHEELVAQGIAQAVPRLAPEGGPAAARAIMTTDTYPKQCAVTVALPGGGTLTIGGMAKGSGMIHPNMATMLCAITTDATIAPPVLDAALRHAANRSFNCISVDGDTSTNDTMLLLANGQASTPPLTRLDTPDGQAFLDGLVAVCQYLAKEVARDGEGATRLITINVRGAASDHDARLAAMAIARSPLVKTALSGADPNWGRVVCAIGYSGADVDPERMALSFGTITVFENGLPLDFDETAVHQLLNAPEVLVEANLGSGNGCATAWTCDFSHEYIRINADYRT